MSMGCIPPERTIRDKGVWRSRALARKVTKLPILMWRVGSSIISAKFVRRMVAALIGWVWETQNIMKSSSLDTSLLLTGFPKKVCVMIIWKYLIAGLWISVLFLAFGAELGFSDILPQ
jgi:CHASE2 domain-containing sensor protein